MSQVRIRYASHEHWACTVSQFYLSAVRKQLVIQIVSSLLLVLTTLKTTIVILSFFNIIDVVICFQGKYVLE